MNPESFGIILIAYIIGLIILYVVIRGAVRDANEELRTSLRISNRLRVEQMKRQGFTDSDIDEIVKKSQRKG